MKDSNLTIRISEDAKARVKQIAKERGMSTANLVVRAAELLDQLDTDRNKRYGISGEQLQDMLDLLYK